MASAYALSGERFACSSAHKGMVLDFRYPLQPAPLVAIIDPRQRSAPLNLGRFETIAAPIGVLLELPVFTWSPGFPMVAFTGVRCGFLSERDRDLLWRRWRVPVYEQLLAADGSVIAEECDAHDGLHLREGASWDGVLADLVTRPCECGLRTPRLVNVRAEDMLETACA